MKFVLLYLTAIICLIKSDAISTNDEKAISTLMHSTSHFHNFSTTASVTESPKGNTWAVLIAGTKDWENYRHQADICHSYHILIENGVKPEHIIVMMYDDIAFNKQNMYPGKIFNEPHGNDVYNGIKIDYSESFVNSEIFLNVLKGNKSGNAGKGSGRVLESGELDYVFVFYVAHGDHEILTMPEGSILHKNELFDTFKIMSENKMYKSMLFYLESCKSGSMFIDLNSEWNIYSITASSESESSFATYCGDKSLPCLGDLFSVNWMKDSEIHDILSETVGTQYDEVKKATSKATYSSNVSEYGNRLIRSNIIAFYQGSTEEIKCPEPVSTANNDESKEQVVDSREVGLLMAERIAYQSGFKKSEVFILMQNFTKMRNQISDFVVEIVKATVNESEVGKVLTMKFPRYTQNKCHQKVIKTFDKCIPLNSNPYAMRFSSIFANLCEILKNETTIIKNLNKKCQNGPLFKGAI